MLSSLSGIMFDWDMVSRKVIIKDPIQKEITQGTATEMKNGTGGSSTATTNGVSKTFNEFLATLCGNPKIYTSMYVTSHFGASM